DVVGAHVQLVNRLVEHALSSPCSQGLATGGTPARDQHGRETLAGHPIDAVSDSESPRVLQNPHESLFALRARSNWGPDTEKTNLGTLEIRKEGRGIDWSGTPGSNRRPSPWQGDALPAELVPRSEGWISLAVPPCQACRKRARSRLPRRWRAAARGTK